MVKRAPAVMSISMLAISIVVRVTSESRRGYRIGMLLPPHTALQPRHRRRAPCLGQLRRETRQASRIPQLAKVVQPKDAPRDRPLRAPLNRGGPRRGSGPWRPLASRLYRAVATASIREHRMVVASAQRELARSMKWHASPIIRPAGDRVLSPVIGRHSAGIDRDDDRSRAGDRRRQTLHVLDQGCEAAIEAHHQARHLTMTSQSSPICWGSAMSQSGFSTKGAAPSRSLAIRSRHDCHGASHDQGAGRVRTKHCFYVSSGSLKAETLAVGGPAQPGPADDRTSSQPANGRQAREPSFMAACAEK